MISDTVEWVIGCFILLLAALGVFAVGMAARETNAWNKWSAAHCKVVGKMRGDTFTTVGPAIGGSGGVAIGVGSTPGKTGYACDDGITYWR